jgi:hypothetical protein
VSEAFLFFLGITLQFILSFSYIQRSTWYMLLIFHFLTSSGMNHNLVKHSMPIQIPLDPHLIIIIYVE